MKEKVVLFPLLLFGLMNLITWKWLVANLWVFLNVLLTRLRILKEEAIQ